MSYHHGRLAPVCRAFSLVLVLGETASALTAGEVILLSDDFNTENGGFPGVINYNSFENFDVADGSVDLIGNGFRDFFPGRGLYVDLDGTTREGAEFVSKASFSLEPDARYMLSFQLANPDQRFGGGSTDNEMTVSLGDAYRETFQRVGLTPFELITREITVDAATTAQLIFSQAGGDHLGVLIDDVLLSVALDSNSDFDGDGQTTGSDFLIWQRGAGRFAGDAEPVEGDADGDGFVDGADLVLWEAGYGLSPASDPGGGQVAAARSIPEPSAAQAARVVAAMAMVRVLARRRRPS